MEKPHHGLDDLKGIISRFINNGTKKVLSISGEWGVGKTYAWKNTFPELKDDQNGHKHKWIDNYSYISLFGINNIQDIKSKIAFSNVPIEKTSKSISSILGKITPSFTIKDKSENDETLHIASATLSGITGAIGGIASIGKDIYIEAQVKNKLICFDDFERSKIDPIDFLGFVSELREERNCKIVLIYNEDKLGGKADIVKEYREKIIDQHFHYNPSPADTVRLAYDNNSDPKPFDHIQMFQDHIIEKCNLLDLNNIRVIHKILDHFQNDIFTTLFEAASYDTSNIAQHNIIKNALSYLILYYIAWNFI